MPTKIVTANGVYDLSEVKTLKDLREEIDLIKAAVKKEEQDLEDHLHRMPQEALKATADAVLPGFLNRMIANGSWKILASGAGLLANPFSKKYSFTKNILGSAKKLGVIALMKGAYNMWKNKKADHPGSAPIAKPVRPVTTVPVKRTK